MTDSPSRPVPAIEAMVARLPTGTRVYVTDSIAVHAGDEIAVFPASSRVTRSDDKLTIVDASSGETFNFPSSATIDQNPNGGRAYVQPEEAVPEWVSKSNGRLGGVK